MSLRWSDERAKIAAAFVKAQGEFGPAKKGKVNPHFKNKYADLGEIWDACSEALAANDIAIIQSPGEFGSGTVGEVGHDRGSVHSRSSNTIGTGSTGSPDATWNTRA